MKTYLKKTSNLKTIIFTICLFTFSVSSIGEIVGGISETKVSDCQSAFTASEILLKSNGHVTSNLKIISCQKQVVAGTNYNFQLELPDGRICHMKVWEKLPNQGRVDYEVNQNESTCLKPEFTGKKSQINETDNGSPGLKTGWMFLSLLVFCVSLI